jgi:hypothetical protein
LETPAEDLCQLDERPLSRRRSSLSPTGGFMVRRSDNPDQQFLLKPEPDLRPLRDWILNRLSRRPERWQDYARVNAEMRTGFVGHHGSNDCSFPTEFRSMETALLEPPYPHRPSATCGRLTLGMKVWWPRFVQDRTEWPVG